MPCSDHGVRDEFDQGQVEKIDNLTRMLCGLLKQFDNPTELKEGPVMPSINLVPGLHEWWADHKATDALREQESVSRRGIRLAQRLTAEAIRAKGIELKSVEGHGLSPAEVQAYLDVVATQIADRLELEARGG